MVRIFGSIISAAECRVAAAPSTLKNIMTRALAIGGDMAAWHLRDAKAYHKRCIMDNNNASTSRHWTNARITLVSPA